MHMLVHPFLRFFILAPLSGEKTNSVDNPPYLPILRLFPVYNKNSIKCFQSAGSRPEFAGRLAGSR